MISERLRGICVCGDIIMLYVTTGRLTHAYKHIFRSCPISSTYKPNTLERELFNFSLSFRIFFKSLFGIDPDNYNHAFIQFYTSDVCEGL